MYARSITPTRGSRPRLFADSIFGEADVHTAARLNIVLDDTPRDSFMDRFVVVDLEATEDRDDFKIKSREETRVVRISARLFVK